MGDDDFDEPQSVPYESLPADWRLYLAGHVRYYRERYGLPPDAPMEVILPEGYRDSTGKPIQVLLIAAGSIVTSEDEGFLTVEP